MKNKPKFQLIIVGLMFMIFGIGFALGMRENYGNLGVALGIFVSLSSVGLMIAAFKGDNDV